MMHSGTKGNLDKSDHPSDLPGHRRLPSFCPFPSLAIGIVGLNSRKPKIWLLMLKLETKKKYGRGLSARLPTTHFSAPENGKLTAHFSTEILICKYWTEKG